MAQTAFVMLNARVPIGSVELRDKDGRMQTAKVYPTRELQQMLGGMHIQVVQTVTKEKSRTDAGVYPLVLASISDIEEMIRQSVALEMTRLAIAHQMPSPFAHEVTMGVAGE